MSIFCACSSHAVTAACVYRIHLETEFAAPKHGARMTRLLRSHTSLSERLACSEVGCGTRPTGGLLKDLAGVRAGRGRASGRRAATTGCIPARASSRLPRATTFSSLTGCLALGSKLWATGAAPNFGAGSSKLSRQRRAIAVTLLAPRTTGYISSKISYAVARLTSLCCAPSSAASTGTKHIPACAASATAASCLA